MQSLTVKIENAYSDGHESKHEVILVVEDDLAPGDTLTDWFEEVVFDYTGDGHGIGNDLGSCYTATIIACDNPALLGQTCEWLD